MEGIILDIDNACYGTLTLNQSKNESMPDFYYVNGDIGLVSFKVGGQALLSSGSYDGKLYCGEVLDVNIENGSININGKELKVANYEYFARVGYEG